MKIIAWLFFLVYFSIVGYQLSMMHGYFVLTPGVCHEQPLIYRVVPVPGAMNSWSWLALVLWLVLGLILSLSVGKFAPRSFFLITLLISLGFIFGITRADVDCRKLKSCGADYQATIARVYESAVANLDEGKCLELSRATIDCQSDGEQQIAADCQAKVAEIKRYKQAGLDVSNCAKTQAGCRDVMLMFYYQNLSNDLEAARLQCGQKFWQSEASKSLCAEYIEQWESSGAKPRP